jgi:hypothetical protein
MAIAKMSIRHTICVLLSFCVAAVAPGRTLAQQVDCEGTRQAWLKDRSMQDFMSKHTCSCSNGANRMPVCVSRSGGGGGSYSQTPAKKKYSGAKAMQYAAMQGLAAGLVAGMMMNLFSAPSAPAQPSQPSYEPTPEQRQKWAEAAQKAKEQMDAVDRAYKEHRAQQATAALSQLKGSLKGRPDPVSSDVQRERASKAIDQLGCSAWFALEAADAAYFKRDPIKAKQYGDLSARAAIGDMPVGCPQPPAKHIPEVPGPLSEIPQVQLYELINDEIKESAAEAEALHAKKDEAEQKVAQLQRNVRELRAQAQPTAAVGEKEVSSEDPLIAEAEKLLAEALKEKSETDLELIRKEKEIEAYKQMYARYETPAP